MGENIERGLSSREVSTYRGVILGAEDIEGVILEAEGSSEVGEDVAGVI